MTAIRPFDPVGAPVAEIPTKPVRTKEAIGKRSKFFPFLSQSRCHADDFPLDLEEVLTHCLVFVVQQPTASWVHKGSLYSICSKADLNKIQFS